MIHVSCALTHVSTLALLVASRLVCRGALLLGGLLLGGAGGGAATLALGERGAVRLDRLALWHLGAFGAWRGRRRGNVNTCISYIVIVPRRRSYRGSSDTFVIHMY